MTLGTQDDEVSKWRTAIPPAPVFLSTYISMCMHLQQPILHTRFAQRIGSKSDQPSLLAPTGDGQQAPSPARAAQPTSAMTKSRQMLWSNLPPDTKRQTTRISGHTWYHAGGTWQSMESLMLTGTP